MRPWESWWRWEKGEEPIWREEREMGDSKVNVWKERSRRVCGEWRQTVGRNLQEQLWKGQASTDSRFHTSPL